MRKIQLSLALLFVIHFNSFSQNIAVNTTGTAAASANLFEVTQSSSTNNTVGIFSSHNGTGTNAYAIWAEATGATNKYAIIVPNGGGRVGIGTNAPSAKAILEMSSTTSGLLIPRLTNAQRGTLESNGTTDAANAGLMIYQTDVGTVAPTGIGYYYWDGTYWTGIGSTISGSNSSSVNISVSMSQYEEFIGDYLRVRPWISDATTEYSPYSLGWTRYPKISTFQPSLWADNDVSTLNHPGVTKMYLGNTSANQVTSMYLTDCVDANTKNFIGIWIIKLGSLSTGNPASGNDFNYKVGLMSIATYTATVGNPTDGIFFETTDNNALWYGTVVRSTATAGNTKTSTAVTPTTNWIKLELRSDATGTTWSFYIDGVFKFSRVYATDKVPAGGIMLTPGFKIEGSTTTSTMDPLMSVDLFYMGSTLTR